MNFFCVSSKVFFMFEALFQLLFLQLTIPADGKGLIRSEQLCPDPNMNGNKGERLYFLNNAMPVISIPVYNLLRNDMRLRKEVPCNFIDVASYGRRTNLVQLSIQAVQLSDTSWNFTGARDCSAFVKFRVQERGIVNETKLCRMYKIKSLEIEYENVTHPPSIWMLPGKRLGFLTPELQLNVDADEAGNQTKFLQIVYKTYYDNNCVFKVQQYVLNPSKSECDYSIMKHRICGTYNCSEQQQILKNLGFSAFDVVVNSEDVVGTLDRARNKGKFFTFQDNMDTYEIIRGDGVLIIRPRGRSTSFHAALFSGMTRAISFLFILSILISCISYQLKPYLRPSSSYENDLSRERGHEHHRRCYRRPASQSLPFHRSPVEEIPMEHANNSPSVYVARPANRHRGYFHHTCHRSRSVGAAPSDLPSYNTQVLEQYCQPPPSYESIQPPSYDETMLRRLAAAAAAAEESTTVPVPLIPDMNSSVGRDIANNSSNAKTTEGNGGNKPEGVGNPNKTETHQQNSSSSNKPDGAGHKPENT